MKFGISHPFPCNYLETEEEQLLIYYDEEGKKPATADLYQSLLRAGFRRSGEQVYRPHCSACNQCESLRISCNEFVPSKSQKRINSKNRNLTVTLNDKYQRDFYPIYKKYIATKHRDGGMYPPSEEQLTFFATTSWLQSSYLCIYLDDVLIGVAITDILPQALSALYMFYDPDYEHLSLGTYAILKQIELAKKMAKTHLYLGYFIEDCDKMRYKQNFYPHERFVGEQWHQFIKNRR